jgi:hypothetical protein
MLFLQASLRPQSSDLYLSGTWDYRCTLSHLASLLKWGLTNFLPGLASNCNPPDLHLPSSWIAVVSHCARSVFFLGYYISLFFHVSCCFGLIYVHLMEQSPLPDFCGLAWWGKTLPYRRMWRCWFTGKQYFCLQWGCSNMVSVALSAQVNIDEHCKDT